MCGAALFAGAAEAQHCRQFEIDRFDAEPQFAAPNGIGMDGDEAVVIHRRATIATTLDFYALVGSSWTFQQQLQTSLGGAATLALDGDRAVAGVPYDGSTGTQQRGAVLAFEKAGGAWAETGVLLDPDGHAFDNFGIDVALDGDVLVVGSPLGEGNVAGSGTAIVYRHDGTAWVYETTLTTDDVAQFDVFGGAVAVEGDVIVVGAPQFELDRGAVWVFRHDGHDWIEEAMLQPSDLADLDLFATRVRLSGDVLAVGSPGFESTPGLVNPGGVFLYRFDGSSWNEEARIASGVPREASEFGRGLDLEGDVLVVGEPARGAGTRPGRAYVYEHAGGGNWVEWNALFPTDEQDNDWFGESVAVSEGWVFVGAPAFGDAAYTYRAPTGRPDAVACNGTGVNAQVLSTAAGPVLGTTWTATIDTTGHPGAGLTLLVAYDTPSFGILSSYGELLVAPEVLPEFRTQKRSAAIPRK